MNDTGKWIEQDYLVCRAVVGRQARFLTFIPIKNNEN
jgi:hypothetical protein